MSRSSINVNNKKIKKINFYKNKKIFSIDNIDVNKILVSKKKYMVNIIHLNTLLRIMIMMLLDHYISLFHKRQDILIN